MNRSEPLQYLVTPRKPGVKDFNRAIMLSYPGRFFAVTIACMHVQCVAAMSAFTFQTEMACP